MRSMLKKSAALLAAMLLDGEARGPIGLGQKSFGKLREPLVRLVQWGRSFGIASAQGSWKIGDPSDVGTRLGQSPLRAPSVFNFFRLGYVPPSSASSATQTPAPEFQLVNESNVSGYLNYMQVVMRSGIYVNGAEKLQSGVGAVDGYDITAACTAEFALVLDALASVNHLNLVLCEGQLSVATRTLIAAAVLLVMACPEYLIQK